MYGVALSYREVKQGHMQGHRESRQALKIFGYKVPVLHVKQYSVIEGVFGAWKREQQSQRPLAESSNFRENKTEF